MKFPRFEVRSLLLILVIACVGLGVFLWLADQNRAKNVFHRIAGFELPSDAIVIWDSRDEPTEGAWTTDFIDVLIFRIPKAEVKSFCANSLRNDGEWQIGKIPYSYSQVVDQGVWLPDCPEYPNGEAVYTFHTKNYDESDAGVTNGLLIAIHRDTGIVKFGRWAY